MNSLYKVTLSVALGLCASSAWAIDQRFAAGPDGRSVFEVRFFDVGEGPFMWNRGEPAISTWTLNTVQKANVMASIRYWAQIIRPAPGVAPTVINVGTSNDENAFGSSGTVLDGDYLISNAQASLQGKPAGELTFDSHAQFLMGVLNFNPDPYVPSQLPRPTSGLDLTAVAFHELAHGLGVANKYQVARSDGFLAYRFGPELNDWNRHMRDDNGNPARPLQEVVCPPGLCNVDYSPERFDVRKDQAYLTGPHVQEALDGGLRGIPLKITNESGRLDSDFMSHLELKNSLMSHQAYRNYTNMMEAEVALMQDFGYDIDRRNFFGYSVYGSNLHVVNNHGYFRRNAQGTAYLPGRYNTATLGLGLHIYGSYNTVHQQADLLTRGGGGAGVRVDGEGNTLVIQPGVRVFADGVNGRGLMFTYGKGHQLVQRGQVQALGPGGIAANFDFGNNALGNDGGWGDYRGSYIHVVEGFVQSPLLDELNGALVSRFDLTGSLAGRAAAIYISPNALVENINIMQGAHVLGDIYSLYNEPDPSGQLRLTRLSFGQAADSTGRATGKPDPGFDFVYSGNIQGGNLTLVAQGGHTALNGDHLVHNLTVEPGARLSGNSHYTLRPGQSFVNQGTVAPGNSIGRIAIEGDYRQEPGAVLLMEVDGSGAHDVLSVSGSAALDGSLVVAPEADWYTTSWALRSTDLVQAASVTGAFSEVDSLLSSPTLQLDGRLLSDGAYQFAMKRSSTAYSRHARTDNARQAGQALDTLVAGAGDDMGPLFQALDFSAPDGSTVAHALQQLSPEAYSTMFAGSLTREHQITDMLAANRRSRVGSGRDWNVFALPFGAGFHQQARGSLVAYDATSYGAVFGLEGTRGANREWTVGMHGAISEQTVSAGGAHDAKGKSTTLNLGVQADYRPEAWGGYLFGQGRLGIEDARMTRRIRFGAYSAGNRVSWTGYSAAVVAGGGYRWKVGEGLSIGPVASLSYTWLSRPGSTESGDDASRLQLSSARFHSLRSSIGVGGEYALTRQNGAVLNVDFRLAWDRELLDKRLVQAARFAGYPATVFSSANTVLGRDSLGLRAGLRYDAGNDLTIGFGVATQLRSGYSSFEGNLALSKRF